jgi:hypothetical protein
MAVIPAVGPVAFVAFAALLALLAGCAEPGERAIEVETGLDGNVPVPGDAAQQVAALTALRGSLDEDGDGFVSPAEAEGYYRRHFDLLDDNNDGRLSRAELEPEAPGTPDLEIASEELVGATEQEYVDDNLRKYKLGTDRTIGMMSTRDFDEMVGTSDPAINDARPGVVLP